MSEQTSNLSLPYIMAAQAQKHVTHNEALRSLDALVQISVEDRDLSTPPSSPVDGARYIVGPQPTNEWQSFEGQIAAFQDDAWAFFMPQVGWIAWVVDENQIAVFSSTGWEVFEGGLGIDAMADGTVTELGVNATADATNRLSVNSDSVLLNHNGSDIQTKLNKKTASDTASVLFQTDFSGRAEFGLTGDDDFHVKVSSDGATFHESLIIDQETGEVSFPTMDGPWTKILSALPSSNERKSNTLYLVPNGGKLDAYVTDNMRALHLLNGVGGALPINHSLAATWTATHTYSNSSPSNLGDGSLADPNYWGNTNSLPVTITAQLATAKAITGYKIARGSNNPGWASSNYSPSSWTVEGSNDNTTWDVLDTQTGVTSIAANGEFVEFTFSNTASYLYYRLVFTAAVSGSWLHVGELEFYE